MNCRHEKNAVPLIHSGNENLVDELVRIGDLTGMGIRPENYVYFGCPDCRMNLDGVDRNV